MPSPSNPLPTVKHLYQNFSMDALRWNYFTPRADDIGVATTYKAGTTWAQTIVANLIFAGELPGSIPDLSPWIDQRIFPLELVLDQVERQTHRRAVKTHLPLDGLPFNKNVTYICVGRDPRDIFMSLWNFHRNFTPEMFGLTNALPGRVGEELRPCPDDVNELWRNWMTRACFPWEHDGYPFGSVLHHARTWWDYRHLPNILLVHFADLLVELEGEVRGIAGFLEIRPPAEAWPRIVHNCTFTEMKKHGDELIPQAKMILRGGSGFFSTKEPTAFGAMSSVPMNYGCMRRRPTVS